MTCELPADHKLLMTVRYHPYAIRYMVMVGVRVGLRLVQIPYSIEMIMYCH